MHYGKLWEYKTHDGKQWNKNLWLKKTDFSRLPHKTQIETRHLILCVEGLCCKGILFFQVRRRVEGGGSLISITRGDSRLSVQGVTPVTHDPAWLYQSPLPPLQREGHSTVNVTLCHCSLELQMWLSLCVTLAWRWGGGASSLDEAVGTGRGVIKNLYKWNLLL